MNAVATASFDAPLLRELDAAARAALGAAWRLVDLAPGAAAFRAGDPGESFYLVIAGAIELTGVRRGDEVTSTVRIARAGDSFGEEAMLAGISRRVTATAIEPSRVAEIPIAVFRRVTGRAGGRAAEREWRYLSRAAARDLLTASAFARHLPADDAEILLDGMRLEPIERGARIYEPGDRAEAAYLLLEGVVQIQREEGARVSVRAYLSRGDFFGDQEALAAAPRAAAAVATGDGWCAVVPAAVLRTLADRNPGLLARLRRVADAQEDAQRALVAGAGSTQHVFRDLYRMQMARSLLVIDQDQCVRCGHCAWSCAEVHGVSRLVRRGDKVVTRLSVVGQTGGPANLMTPNTCQQCRNAACMIDCPTGAIGRDTDGEVFIRPELCTGCGNCAKTCPWDNIQMAPRGPAGRDVAVKCELCRGYAAPACVEACPTEAILRVDPSRDFAEVAQIFGAPPPVASAAPAAPDLRRWIVPVAAAGSLAVAGAAIALQRAGTWVPGRGPGLAAGITAGLLIAALSAYAIPKRIGRARKRSRRDPVRPLPRSRTRPHFIAHLALGLLAPAAVLAHAGARLPASPAGALSLAVLAATLLGAFGALAYRVLPRRLTRIERRGALPEDLRGERDLLLARLHREAAGTSDLVKAIADRVLLPYARAPLGGAALAASGRTLAEEEARLAARIDRALEGRGHDRREGLERLIRTAVELRALPARRALTASLRAWLPIHMVAAAVVLALLLAHVAMVVR
ncbi:MAG TPA: cyclic nucleotide-binding domain-containing protein [Kofleriaceae bacterium]|nr:cyclic nucleotide-binding domain-containing protein [Kofleriaceae bacterium]